MPAAFNQSTKTKLLSKSSKKWVRMLTVVVYVTSVSIAAVFLALYYSLLWRPQLSQSISGYSAGDFFRMRNISDSWLMEPVQNASTEPLMASKSSLWNCLVVALFDLVLTLDSKLLTFAIVDQSIGAKVREFHLLRISAFRNVRKLNYFRNSPSISKETSIDFRNFANLQKQSLSIAFLR